MFPISFIALGFYQERIYCTVFFTVGSIAIYSIFATVIKATELFGILDAMHKLLFLSSLSPSVATFYMREYTFEINIYSIDIMKL